MIKHSQNIIHVLQNREYGFFKNLNTFNDLKKIAEEKAASSEMEEIHCKLPSSVRSTFLMSFSPDCSKVASTHGDHKIYVCDVKTGKLLHKLEGHPRTPWCVVFHPTSNDILASGCLGGEVRVWDLHGGSEQWCAEQNTVITSLTFHPFDKVLVIATYNRIHFWNWNFSEPFATCYTGSIREKVRFVKFNRLGTRLITGILNPPDTITSSEHSTTSTTDRTVRTSQETFAGPNDYNYRRSMWTRLMNMYQHLDSSEDFQRTVNSENSPTLHEEALDRARQYAESVTQANRLQRQLNDSQSSISSDNLTNSNHSELSNSHEELLVRAFWRTFNRLRTICSALERRMHQLQRRSEASTANEPSSSSNNFTNDNNNSSNNHNSSDPFPNHNATSEQLINILTRLQNSLQFSAITESVPPEQIQQLQWRISEILERLTNVTGYRARLATLRDHIVEVAERSVQRNEGPSPVSRHDLAHCLFLVEMCLQLTRQMQRILQTDYGLIRMHLTYGSPSSQRNSSNSTNPTTVSSLCVFHGRHGLTSSETNEESFNSNYLSRREREFREIRQRIASFPTFTTWQPTETTTNSGNNGRDVSDRILRTLAARSLLSLSRSRQYDPIDSQQMSDISANESSSQREHSAARSLLFFSRLRQNLNSRRNIFENLRIETSPQRGQPNSDTRSLFLSRSQTDQNVRSHSFNNLTNESNVQREHSNILQSSHSNTGLPSSNENRNSLSVFYVPNDDNSDSSDSSDDGNEFNSNRVQVDTQQLRYEQRNFQNAPTSNMTFNSNTSRRTTFYIPSVRVDPSQDDDVSIPVQERPRLSTILSGTNSDFSIWQYEPYFTNLHPYFSQAFYEASRRSQFSTHESGNSSNVYRIQAWDLSNYDIPAIMNAKANIVVPKCKIHNDASISVSQDGEILVALVPSGVIDLVTFAVYSLKPENLGHCLYRSMYEGNAISVSLSPCNHYVVVGITPHRLMDMISNEKEAVAHIYSLKPVTDNEWIGFNVRSLSQQSSLNGQVSLNSVQWLPQSGQGLIYGTNKGCLCICKPIAPMILNKSKSKTWKRFRMDNSDESPPTRRRRGGFNISQQMSSTSTQTTEPTTQTTGTQTFSIEGNSGFL